MNQYRCKSRDYTNYPLCVSIFVHLKRSNCFCLFASVNASLKHKLQWNKPLSGRIWITSSALSAFFLHKTLQFFPSISLWSHIVAGSFRAISKSDNYIELNICVCDLTAVCQWSVKSQWLSETPSCSSFAPFTLHHFTKQPEELNVLAFILHTNHPGPRTSWGSLIVIFDMI